MEIKFLKPEFPAIHTYALDLLKIYRNNQFSNKGPYLLRFENALKAFLDTRPFTPLETKPVCLSNATMGLVAALKALDLPIGGGVLVPSFTFPATIQAIKICQLRPIYVDVNLSDFGFDILDLRRKIIENTNVVCVMPVCAMGCSIDENVLMIARVNQIPVIIDAAGALGLQNWDPWADAIVYSFHSTKMLPVGEGGCVVFAKKEHEERCRQFIDFGFNSERVSVIEGLNCKMPEIEAAIGLSALRRLPKIIKKRVEIRNKYYDVFNKLLQAKMVRFQSGNPLQLHMVVCESKRLKSDLEYHLNSKNIETRGYYNPCHKMPYLMEGFQNLPNTDQVYERSFCVPMYSKLTDKEIDYMAKVVNDWGYV